MLVLCPKIEIHLLQNNNVNNVVKRDFFERFSNTVLKKIGNGKKRLALVMSRSNIDLAHIKVLMVKLYDFFEDQEISITPEDFNFEVNDFVDTFQNIADSVDATKVCQAAETYLPKLDL